MAETTTIPAMTPSKIVRRHIHSLLRPVLTVLRAVGVLLLIELPELLIELPEQLCHPVG